ncbi:MAG: hypothetical protein ABIF17_02200 [Patescibacteria group bacterium]
MKKNIFKLFFTAFILMAILTPLVFFQGQGGFADFAVASTNPAVSGLNRTAGDLGLSGDGDPISITANIVKFILGFLGLIFLLLLIYAGFLRMTAQGSPEKIKSSNGIITSAIVGVFIILASYIITVFVIDQIDQQVGGGGGGGNANNCPTGCSPNPCIGTRIEIQSDCPTGQYCCIATP